MEQKQIDEEESYGEEFIDDEVVKKSSTKKTAKKKIVAKKEPKKKEIKIEPVVVKKEEKKEEKTKTEETNSEQFNVWKFTAMVAIILLLVSLFSNGFNLSLTGSSTVKISDAEKTVLNFVNDYLLQPPFMAEVVGSKEMNNLYLVTLSVAGQQLDTYITKDGTMFFPQGFKINEEIPFEEEFPTEIVEVSVADGMTKGDINAPVTIIEFSEFECPYCAMYYQETYPEIIKNYVETGKVRYVFRHIPLDFHQNAQKAAEAAECAGVQGKFWEMHDSLFEFNDILSVENLKLLARELDLNTDQFNTCLDNNEMEAKVLADLQDARSYGVTGTPTFFVNGEMLEGAQPYSTFEQVIEKHLSEPEEVKEEVQEPVISDVKEFNINARKWLFEPNRIEVNNGDKVILNIVADGLEFTFSVPEFGVTEEVTGSAKVEFVATKSGEFVYKCASCEDWRGMTGTLKVN